MDMYSDDMIRVQKYIESNLENDITLEKLCGFARYSEFYFVRIFKKKIGMTPMEYVIKRRLIKASEDIINGEKIIDVAIKYNWQSHSGFSKCFKKEFGFYPSLLKAMILEMNQIGGSAMSHVYLDTLKVGMNKEELYEILQEKLVNDACIIDANLLKKVFETACRMYEGVFRYSGEEYVTHTLNVAIILTDLEVNINVILAGLFSDAYKKGVMAIEDIKAELPDDVYKILKRLEGDSDKDLDEEVACIKIAERLHNMRTIDYMGADKKKMKAKETLTKYMPIAQRLNNTKLINELNHLSLKYCE